MPYAHKALDNINLDIKEGVITAIIGETGSGKSTLVEHLNALLLPSEGSLTVLDHEIIANTKNKNLKSLRKDVGLVFQFSEYQLFEETVLKDVAFGPTNFGYSIEEATALAKQALKLVDIDESYQDGAALFLLGDSYRLTGDTEAALECFEKVVELYPKNKWGKQAAVYIAADDTELSAADVGE